MADENERSPSAVVNGNSKHDTVISNGINHLDGETDKRSESSTTSSTQILTDNNSRGLPPVPQDEQPPPLPKQPPRNDKLPPRIRTSRPPSAQTKFIPETEITIPQDGSLAAFTPEELCTFFKHIGVEDRIVNHLQRKSLDGKKFSKLKDSDLETIGIKNPIIMHFRDKSRGGKKRIPFML